MKTKVKNMMYQSSTDGYIFKYKVGFLLGIISRLIGLNRQIEISLNVVLDYQKTTYSMGFTLLELIVERSKYGVDAPNPVKARKILFVSLRSEFLESVETAIKRNIQQSQEGVNIGLSHLNPEKVKAFYARKNIGSETPVERRVLGRLIGSKHYQLGQLVDDA